MTRRSTCRLLFWRRRCAILEISACVVLALVSSGAVACTYRRVAFAWTSLLPTLQRHARPALLSLGRDVGRTPRAATRTAEIPTTRRNRSPSSRHGRSQQSAANPADLRALIARGQASLDEEKFQDARVPLIDALSILDSRGVQLSAETDSGPGPAKEDVLLAVKVFTKLGDSHIGEWDAESAISAYGAAKHLLETSDGLRVEGESGADLLMKIGFARSEATDFEGALESYASARDLLVNLGAKRLQTRLGSEVLIRIGDMLAQMGSLEEALTEYESAAQILETIGLLETKGDASLLANMGAIHAERGDVESAVQTFQRARQLFQRLRLLDTPEGAALLANLGMAVMQRGLDGDAKSALKDLSAAHKFYKANGMLSTPEGAVLLEALGDACMEVGNVEAADKYYAAFQRIVTEGLQGQETEAPALTDGAKGRRKKA